MKQTSAIYFNVLELYSPSKLDIFVKLYVSLLIGISKTISKKKSFKQKADK